MLTVAEYCCQAGLAVASSLGPWNGTDFNHAARSLSKSHYIFCEFKECPPPTRSPLTPTSLTAAKVSKPGLRTRANARATP